jgi:hypothetical protein
MIDLRRCLPPRGSISLSYFICFIILWDWYDERSIRIKKFVQRLTLMIIINSLRTLLIPYMHLTIALRCCLTKKKMNCLYSISIINLNMMSAPQGQHVDKPDSIEWQTSTSIWMIIFVHPIFFVFVSYSIIHIHIYIYLFQVSVKINQKRKSWIDRSIVSLYCHHFLLYMYALGATK